MPLSKRARIEIYLPQRGSTEYSRLQRGIEREFIETFGGCTVIRDIKGLYLSSERETDADMIHLIYADTPFDFDENFQALSEYTDHLRDAALEASEEESILVVVHEIFHSL